MQETSYEILIYTLIAAFLIMGIYIFIVCVKAKKQTWPMWHSLISTIVSVLLGITIAVLIYYHQRDLDSEFRKNRHLYILGIELAMTWQVLNHKQDEGLDFNIKDKKFTFMATEVQAVDLREAALSGLFNEFNTSVLLEIARHIDFYNNTIKTILIISPSLKNNDNSAQIAGMLQKAHKEARASIVNALLVLNRSINLDHLGRYIEKFPMLDEYKEKK